MIEALTSAMQTQPADQAFGRMGTDAFLKLLVAQLRYQNPMEPADATTMLEQTAQFTTVETLKSLAAIQQQLMGFSQVSLASSMVGKEVTAVAGDGSPIQGVVETTTFGPDGPILVVEGKEVPLARVTGISVP